MVLRPQQRRAKDHADLIKNIRRGDTVVTDGGLIGKVTKVVDDSELEVEVAPNVRVRIARPRVNEVRAKGEPVKDAG
jgi:preprotein translocase subunit YajC